MAGNSVTGVGPGIAYRPSEKTILNCLRLVCSNTMDRFTSNISDDIQPGKTTYKLTQIPVELFMFRNGLLQTDGVDYILSGNMVTFSPGNIPQLRDVLVARIYFTPITMNNQDVI